MANPKNIQKLIKVMERWPKSWMGFPEDIPVGERIVEVMRPFVQAMVHDGLAPKAINRHMDNLWHLGGEIIRDVNMETKERKRSGRELILKAVDQEGGPYCRHLSTEAEAKPFDATCKKLYRFIRQQQG